MIKKAVLYFLLFIVCIPVFAQQLPYYTQYANNSPIINPAITGTKRTLDARIGYRNQWLGYDGAPKTETVSINGRFYKGKMGAGLYLMQDKIGPSVQTNLGASYAFHIRFPDCEFSAGVAANFTRNTLVGGDILLHNTQDPSINQFVTDHVWVPDANAGIYLYNDRFNIGVSAMHLIESTTKFYKNDTTKHGKMKYITAVNFMLGYNFAQNPDYIWQSSVAANYVSGVPFMLDYSLILRVKQKMLGGISLRLKDAVALHIGVVFLDDFQITYSYDLLISKLRNYSSGSHEIMIVYSTKLNNHRRRSFMDTQFLKQRYSYMF